MVARALGRCRSERLADDEAEPLQQSRDAVGLHLEGLTTHEIADLLGWNEPKARNLVYRGLNDIRRCLKEAGIEYETQ